MKILTLSSLYPNNIQPNNGLFVETRLKKLIERYPVTATVVAPVPWFPFKNEFFGRYGAFARVSEEETRNGIRIIHPRFPVVPKLGMSISPYLMAKSTLKPVMALHAQKDKFDLIDAHYFYPDGVAAALLSQWLEIPLVITARGSDINLISKYAGPRLQMISAGRKASRLIAVSGHLRKKMVEMGLAAEHIETLRNGVDLEFFKLPQDRERLRRQLGFQRKVLLSVGNLVRLKGHDLIIQALSKIPDSYLVIVGHGEEEQRLKTLVRNLDLEDRVRFTGSLPQEVLRDYYAAADALILASSSEGWPNVILESLACGTPAIGTPVGGVAEIINSSCAGLLVKERTAAAIVEAVYLLFCSLPDRADTRKFAEQFDWDDTSDGQWKIFSAAKASS